MEPIGTWIALIMDMKVGIACFIALTAVVSLTGCDPASAPSATAAANAQGQDCIPFSQTIAFSGSATVTNSSAIADGASQGTLALGVVSPLVDPSFTFRGMSSDGTIAFSDQTGTGSLSAVQGTLQISAAAYDSAVSLLGGTSNGQCIQSMTFDLEISDQTLYGGHVVVTVNGSAITLSF